MMNSLTRQQILQALILVALSTIDLAMTYLLIITGIGLEGNPVFSGIAFIHIGSIKCLTMVIVIGVCYYLRKDGIIILLNKVMAAVVIWNLILILITIGAF